MEIKYTTYEYLDKLYKDTKIARDFAIKVHKDTNHIYGNELPYDYHLASTVQFGLKYLYLIPEDMHIDVISALWCHDTIEDARQTYNDVKKIIGERAADIVFALTNEKGKERSDRANDKYYSEMVQIPYAVFCKLCDKLANATYSKKEGSSMLKKYKREQPHFEIMVYDPSLQPMFDELNEILD